MAKHIKFWLIFALMVGVSVACDSINPMLDSVPETTNQDAFGLDELFSLDGGKTAVLVASDLQLHFTEVVEDSRCPKSVECFWSGQAVIIVTAEKNGEEIELVFNTNLAPSEAVDTLPAFDYMVHLEQLDPYPKNPEDPIAFADYQAQLMVKRP